MAETRAKRRACETCLYLMDELRRLLMPDGCEWPRYEDGEPVQFGDDVSRNGEDFEANAIALYRDGSFSLNFRAYSKGERVKRPAVPAADGEPLEVGQTVWDTNGDELVVVALEDGGNTVTCRYADVGDGIPVHGMWSPSDLTHQRPVLDALGNRIEPAMDVWWVCEGDELGIHAEKLHVDGIDGDGMVECSPHNGGTSVVLDPAELYVNKPVLDADGVPIKVGDTVWCVATDDEFEDMGILTGKDKVRQRLTVRGIFFGNCEPWVDLCETFYSVKVCYLTHTKPEPPDSWERLEEDAWDDDCEYFGRDMNDCKGCPASRQDIDDFYCDENEKARDLVRRARALAEKENRNE